MPVTISRRPYYLLVVVIRGIYLARAVFNSCMRGFTVLLFGILRLLFLAGAFVARVVFLLLLPTPYYIRIHNTSKYWNSTKKSR